MYYYYYTLQYTYTDFTSRKILIYQTKETMSLSDPKELCHTIFICQRSFTTMKLLSYMIHLSSYYF